MDKQSKSRAATRENLLAAFWSLYQKKRIEKITVREITQLAGYNRGTFYDYFIDIYDVLDQFQDSLLDYTRVAIDKYRSDGINQEIVEYITNTFHTKGEYFSVFLGGNRDPNFPDKMKKVIRPIFYEVWGLHEDSEEAAHIFEFAISAIIGALSHWYRSEMNMPYEKFLSMTKSMMASGVFTELEKISSRQDARFLFKEVLEG